MDVPVICDSVVEYEHSGCERLRVLNKNGNLSNGKLHVQLCQASVVALRGQSNLLPFAGALLLKLNESLQWQQHDEGDVIYGSPVSIFRVLQSLQSNASYNYWLVDEFLEQWQALYDADGHILLTLERQQYGFMYKLTIISKEVLSTMAKCPGCTEKCVEWIDGLETGCHSRMTEIKDQLQSDAVKLQKRGQLSDLRDAVKSLVDHLQTQHGRWAKPGKSCNSWRKLLLDNFDRQHKHMDFRIDMPVLATQPCLSASTPSTSSATVPGAASLANSTQGSEPPTSFGNLDVQLPDYINRVFDGPAGMFSNRKFAANFFDEWLIPAWTEMMRKKDPKQVKAEVLELINEHHPVLRIEAAPKVAPPSKRRKKAEAATPLKPAIRCRHCNVTLNPNTQLKWDDHVRHSNGFAERYCRVKHRPFEVDKVDKDISHDM